MLTIFIIYDGIHNTVFKSQVLEPLKNQPVPCIIISFEKSIIDAQEINKLEQQHNVHIIQCKRLPFLGKLSLLHSTYQLKRYVKKIKNTYTLVARGPFAAWVALKSATTNCQHITIQIRGIAPEEYDMEQKDQYTWLKKIRCWQLTTIEREAYSLLVRKPTITLQTVSNALRDFIIKKYHANPAFFALATHDIPAALDVDLKNSYRQTIRKQLQLSADAIIYCYAGSAKIWQCPDKAIEFMQEKLKHSNNFFLILSQDKEIFNHACKNLPQKQYAVLSAAPQEVIMYLAACDYGLLFREPHIVNWVSRPTKALEYKAAGLPILHNNTVEYLQNS